MPAKTRHRARGLRGGVGFAELFGAKNLGTALGVGQLTFVIALVYVLMRR